MTMEIQVNEAIGIKKIVAPIVDGIMITVYNDNTATITQDVIQHLPRLKDFYNQMDKKSVRMSKQLREKLRDYLHDKLNVADNKTYDSLNEIETLFLQFGNYS